MARTMRQPFSPTAEYVARRSFVVNGHTFAAGDNFPWRRLAVDIRKLHRLHEQRFIDVKGDEIELIEETPVVDEPLMDSTEGDDEVIESSEEGFMFDPEVHTLVHPDSGQWWIMKGEDQVLRINRKEWKRLEQKTKPTEVRLDRVVTED